MATPQEQTALGDIALVVEDPLRSPQLTLPESVKFNSRTGNLEWKAAGEHQPNPNARGLLQKFVDLHEKPDWVLATFAEKYGVLGLTGEGRIEGSGGTWGPKQDLMTWDAERGVFLERIAYWRPYIAALRYVTALFTRLRANPHTSPLEIYYDCGFPTLPDDRCVVGHDGGLWESFELGAADFDRPLDWWFAVSGPGAYCDNLQRVGGEDALKWLSWAATNDWVPIGGLHFALASDGVSVSAAIRLGGLYTPGAHGIMPENTLRSVLTAQLMAIAVRPTSSELLACSNCGTFYEPLRMPPRGKPHYCPTCKPIIAREQKRQWAARNRKAQRIEG